MFKCSFKTKLGNDEEENDGFSSFLNTSTMHHTKNVNNNSYRVIKITEIIEVNDDQNENFFKIKNNTTQLRACQHVCETCKLLKEEQEKQQPSTTFNSKVDNNKKVIIKITGRSRSSSVDMSNKIDEAIAKNINSSGGQNTVIITIPSSPSLRNENQDYSPLHINDYELPFDNITPPSSLKKKKAVNFKKDLVDSNLNECELRKNVLRKNCLKKFNYYDDANFETNKYASEEYVDLNESLEDICRLSDDDLMMKTKKNSGSNNYYAKLKDRFNKK